MIANTRTLSCLLLLCACAAQTQRPQQTRLRGGGRLQRSPGLQAPSGGGHHQAFHMGGFSGGQDMGGFSGAVLDSADIRYMDEFGEGVIVNQMPFHRVRPDSEEGIHSVVSQGQDFHQYDETSDGNFVDYGSLPSGDSFQGNNAGHIKTSFDRGFTPPGSNNGHGASGGYRACPSGRRQPDGRCGPTAQVTRSLYLFRAPQPQPTPIVPAKNLPPPKVHYNYVFLKTHQNAGGVKPLVAPPPTQKTLVYVLSKRPEAQTQQVIEVPSEPTHPEVFFVNYDHEGDNTELPGGINLQEALGQFQQQGQVIDVQATAGGNGYQDEGQLLAELVEKNSNNNNNNNKNNNSKHQFQEEVSDGAEYEQDVENERQQNHPHVGSSELRNEYVASNEGLSRESEESPLY